LLLIIGERPDRHFNAKRPYDDTNQYCEKVEDGFSFHDPNLKIRQARGGPRTRFCFVATSGRRLFWFPLLPKRSPPILLAHFINNAIMIVAR